MAPFYSKMALKKVFTGNLQMRNLIKNQILTTCRCLLRRLYWIKRRSFVWNTVAANKNRSNMPSKVGWIPRRHRFLKPTQWYSFRVVLGWIEPKKIGGDLGFYVRWPRYVIITIFAQIVIALFSLKLIILWGLFFCKYACKFVARSFEVILGHWSPPVVK